MRGDGGFAVLPPSVHASGRHYTWDLAPDETHLAEVPAWLLERMRGGDRNGKAPPIPDEIPEGQRNTTLASLAGSMRRRRASEATIVAALRAENEGRCCPPLDDAEVLQIAKSISKYPPPSVNAPPARAHAPPRG